MKIPRSGVSISIPAASKRLPPRADLETLGSHLGLRGQPERDERCAVRLGELRGEPLSPLVADVHGSRRRVRPDEEPPLGLEVLLQRAVQVEMILGQVREDERVETNPTEPPEGRAVRGRFDRGAPVPRVEHLPEETLELDRLGCGEGRATLLAADDPADGPDQSGPAIRGLEHRVQKEGRRRLAVRPRHADDLELLRRLPEEHIRGDSHRRADVLHDELRNVDLEQALDHESDRAPFDRLPREIVTVDPFSRDAEEERALRHRARVVGKVADHDRPGSGHLARGERPDQGLELQCADKASGTRAGLSSRSPQNGAPRAARRPGLVFRAIGVRV